MSWEIYFKSPTGRSDVFRKPWSNLVFPTIQSAQDRVWIARLQYAAKPSDLVICWVNRDPTVLHDHFRTLYPHLFRSTTT